MCGLVTQKFLWCCVAFGSIARIRRKKFQNKVSWEILGLEADKVTEMQKKYWEDLMLITSLKKSRKLTKLESYKTKYNPRVVRLSQKNGSRTNCNVGKDGNKIYFKISGEEGSLENCLVLSWVGQGPKLDYSKCGDEICVPYT